VGEGLADAGNAAVTHTVELYADEPPDADDGK